MILPLARLRFRAALALAALWLLASLGGAPWAGNSAGKGGNPAAPQALDSAAAQSDSGGVFVPLARRPVPAGAYIAALAVSPKGLWAVGDSGLIAFSVDDSVFRRLDSPDKLPLRCARFWGDVLVCAGDSGRVFRVAEGKARRATLHDMRAVLDISSLGEDGLLGGEAGLLARSRDSGRSWDTLAAPLPMRFSAVLCRPEGWWAGGAGGRLFFSIDKGDTWRALEPLPAPLADLAAAGDAVAVLDRAGGLFLATPVARRALGRAPVGRAHSLVAVTGGWAVSGEGGRLAQLDTLDGVWRPGRLPVATVLDALAFRDGDLLMAGAWGTLAAWHGGAEAPVLLSHSLTRLSESAGGEPGAPFPLGGDSLLAGGSAPDSAAAIGPRYFQNVVETDTRCTTPPTRLRQLERSYDNSRWLGVTGRAMLAADVGAKGQLDSLFLLDEWPAGVGVGKQALQLGSALTFTPGFRKSGMVRSRMLLPIVFSGSESDYISWASGQSAAGELLDSLLVDMPRLSCPLPPKALVKAMAFPRKAKRFVWEGEAVVEYQLDRDGDINNGRVLWESEARYGFGAHALQIIPKLKMIPPDSLVLAPGDHLRVVQHLRFDRKRYKRAAKEQRDGFRFSEVKLCAAESDSAAYQPGLAQLEWLLNDFQGATGEGEWPELEVLLVLRHDGRVHDLQITPRPGDARSIDAEALRGLAVLFTWGHPLAATEDKTDTLSFIWKPAAFKADSLNQPASLRALLRGVVY